MMGHVLTDNQIGWLAKLGAWRVESFEKKRNGVFEIVYKDKDGKKIKKGIAKESWQSGYTTYLEERK